MTWQGGLQIAVFAALVTAAVKPLGLHIAGVAEGQGASRFGLRRVENGIYRLAGVDPAEEQGWIGYAVALLSFHVAGIVLLYVLQRIQSLLPLNPQGFAAVGPDLALNTAVSFATNTSWQSYGGETTLGYLAQMAGITVQSFLSCATGVAVALALVRGIARRSVRTIGRTPEYLGKKIEANEVKMAMVALLCVPAFILGLTAIAAVLPAGLAGPSNAGPHGFSEMLYAYTSAAATNGSAFAGLNANTPFYNLTLAAGMFAGRFLVIVPVLAIAGTLARKLRVPASAGTLPTHGPLFVTFLVGTIVIVGGLTFFPALAIGPLAEHLVMHAGITY
jgi:potassium-transporting ATPase potassium-binding subunit